MKSGVSEGKATNPPISIISIIWGPQTIEIIEIIEMGPISIISIISPPQTIEIIEKIEMGPISIISIN